MSRDWSSGARQHVALAAFGALPALWEDREGEWKEQDGSTEHLAMPSKRPLDSGGSPGLGEKEPCPLDRGELKAAQDGRKGRAHPIQRSLWKGRVSSVCAAQ